MKKLILMWAIILGWSGSAWSEGPGTLTTLRAIQALSNAEASQGLPAAFEATVTYSPGYQGLLFVQDGDLGIFVRDASDEKLVRGDRVLVKGKTSGSFRPIVISSSVTVLQHGALPLPEPATFDELAHVQRDAMLVTVRGVVRTADLRMNSTVRVTYLQMLMDGGYIDVTVDSDDANALKELLDAEVELTGVAGGKFDGKMQQTGILIHVASWADVKIVKRAAASPWSLPVTPMDKVLTGYHVQDLTQRVRVRGTITYYQPGSAIVLQDGTKSLWITTPAHDALQLGDVADASGFPEAHNGFLALTHGEIQDSEVQAPVTPQLSTWRQLAFWSSNQPVGHQYDLVSIEGQVVTEVREAAQDTYVLISDSHLFTARYRHPDATSQLPLSAMKEIPIGARVRVTGICLIDDTNPFNTSKEVPFDILMRSFDDMAIVAQPSWRSVRNLTRIVGVLLLVVVAACVWGWTLTRKVHRQTTVLAKRIEAEAAMERRRSRILEEINGSLPLAAIIEQITEMVSFSLNGAPSWCEVTGGARLGNYPPETHGLRIVREEIAARSGPPLGVLFAGLDPLTAPGANETEALSLGARLTTVAIETRRLYSDLVHRSEFDLLTDINNRFALDKHLDATIEEARQKAGAFGLIYVDLDEFKQVNDLYGHHVGDLYLQEAALRMKSQLRGADMLARLGGDEFAAVIAVVRNRADGEEIAQRLEQSFNDPFVVGGHVLHGSASVGLALYPEDGATKDSLLSAADAAMYVAKQTNHERGRSRAAHRGSGFTSTDRD